MIAINLCKQRALDPDPTASEQIKFTGNVDRSNSTRIFFILEEARETVLVFSQRTVKAF